MRAFYVLMICIFAATVIHTCESVEQQAEVADFKNIHPRLHSAWKTVKENMAKESAISSEAELSGSNVNPEEIVQQAKLAADRAKTYPTSFKEWEEKLKRKMAQQKAVEKTTQKAKLASPKAHSKDKEEMKVHAASPEPSMTIDEWEKRFNDARKSNLNTGKNNEQQVKTAASTAKVYSESRKDLEQEIDEQVKISSPRGNLMHRPPWEEKDFKGTKQEIKQRAKLASPRPINPYPYYPSTVEIGEEEKEAVLQREREKIMQRYNEIKQNAMVFDRDDVKERIHQEARRRGYPWRK